MQAKSLCLFALLSCSLLCACASTQPRLDESRSSSPVMTSEQTRSPDSEQVLAKFHAVNDVLYSGGQPDVEDWAALADAGIGSVINLRPVSELPDRDEAAEVTTLGLHYRNLPIANAADINVENADALWQAIQSAHGKVLVHCASGNRVGALLAIAAQRHQGLSAQQALDYGKSAGLTRLEPIARERLGLPALPRE